MGHDLMHDPWDDWIYGWFGMDIWVVWNDEMKVGMELS